MTLADYITTANIAYVVGTFGIVFGIYNRYFRDPQEATDKRDALLAQRIQNYIESTDNRFKQIQDSFTGLLLQSNNHIHTVETKVDALTVTSIETGKDLVLLHTIIDERIPKK